MEIRRATQDDLQTILEMAIALHDESPQYRDRPVDMQVSAALCVRAVTDPHFGTFIAWKDGQPIGIIGGPLGTLMFNRDVRATDAMFCVVPDWRGTRVGALLLTAFEDWAREMGAFETHMVVTSGIEMERAMGLYKRLGYEVVGHVVRKLL